MAEILPGVHQVEGIAVCTYLVKDSGPTWTLIDSGLPGSEAGVAAYLKQHGIPPESVTKILLTHCHRDHIGALTAVAQLTKARTYAHWLEAAFIACDPAYDGPGTPPAESFAVTQKLKDGDTVDAGGGLVAYHTPGHTPGHTVYYHPERKWLFSGDLFFGDGSEMVLTTKEYTQHRPSAVVSARRVAELPVESILTYHGGPFLKGGGATLKHLVGGL